MASNKIILSGASGDLGSRITSLLLDKVDPKNLILLSRTPDKLADLRAKGVEVRYADFEDTATLQDAMQGGDILMLISTLSIGRRALQHGNAITAAKNAGIRHIVYTSSTGIHPCNPALSAQEHHLTELLLYESGLTFTMLRNGWFADVIPLLVLPAALASGSIVASSGDGHVAPVFKQDCARVAATVLASPDKHENTVYEISGPELLNLTDITRLCSEVSGKTLQYQNVSHEEKLAIFDQMGVNRDYEEGMMNDETSVWPSTEMITYEQGIRQHYFAICSHHVQLITGTPATPFREVIEFYRSSWESK